MKKFLPLILFLVVFGAVLAVQVGYKIFSNSTAVIEKTTEYLAFEKLFMEGHYKTVQGPMVETTKLDSPVIIYNFWASWCIPCLEEMPSMIAMKNKFAADKIKILAINTDEEDQLANIQKTMKKINMKDEFVIIPDENAKLVTDFKISAIPVTIVFHRGRVVHLSNGPMDFNSEEFILKMKEWVSN